MNQKDLADRFSSEVDHLLHEVGLTDLAVNSTEDDELLKLARTLATTDFSKQSHIRHSLRRRLLNRVEQAAVTSAEIPGPLSLFKQRFKPDQTRYERPINKIGLFKNRFILATLAGLMIIVGFIALISQPALQVRSKMISLLAQVLAYFPAEPDGSSYVLTQQWRFRGEGGISSDPVAADGVIYAGSNTGYLYALDSQTGREIWRFKSDNSINLAPAAAEQMVYAASGEYLYALDGHTGLERWRFKGASQFSAAPAAIAGTVYAGSDNGQLYALDAQIGRERWRFKAGNAILSITAAERTLYVGSQDRYLYALELESGQEKWRFKAGDWISTAPIEVAGLVYVGSHDENLYVLDAETGQEEWRYKTGAAVRSSAALAEGVIYFGSYDSHLYAVDAETGQEKWRFKMSKQTRSSPVMVDGVVYIGSGDGYLYGIDAQTGEEVERYGVDSQIYTAPTTVGSVLYFVSGRGELYAVRREPVASAEEQPETRAESSAKNEPPSFQFTPGGWYILGQDEVIRFRGRMIDGAGNPVNGFSIQAANGSLSILSAPSGPNRWQPKAGDGEWEIVIPDVKGGTGWWWLTAVRYECTDGETDFNPHCQKFSRLSESVKVEVVYPDEMVIKADWTCHWDCQNTEEK